MGYFADDKSIEEMKRWRDIIDKYNKDLGLEPEYELAGISQDADGGLILKLRKLISPSSK